MIKLVTLFTGFILADKGYDVWMANARGSIYSRKHTNLTTNTNKYWRFRYTVL